MSKMSKQDLMQNYEWKVIRRILLKEFPWLIDLELDSENLEKYFTVLINLVIDPFVFSDTFSVKIKKYILNKLINNEEIEKYYLPLIFDVSVDFEVELYDKIFDLVDLVTSSKSLPDELKFSHKRQISIDYIIIRPNEKFVEEAKKRLYG